MQQPNIIMIMTDQMRGDAMSCAGHPDIETPNIDFLASRGTRFSRAYSAVPSCLPARATLWSGQSQWHTGVLGMGAGQGQIPNDFPHTLPGELAHAGYQTHLVGKGHFHPQRTSMGFESAELDESGRMWDQPEEDDYRQWFAGQTDAHVSPDDHGVFWNSWHARPWHLDEDLHPTAWTMWRSIEFLRARDRNRPFFLNISFARPHSPYVPPAVYFDRYERKPLSEPVVGGWASRHDDAFEAADPNAWRGVMPGEQVHRARAGYFGEISFIDQQIGRLTNYLARHDAEAYANTWFVFLSDHGDMLGDHNLWRKTYAYDGSARIPFIVTPPIPSARRGERVSIAGAVVELRDVMPTVLEIAGIDAPATVDGASVLPLTKSESAADVRWRDYLHGEHCTCYSSEQEMHYLTDGRQKYIWFPRLDEEQLFDLVADPGERVDLTDHPTHQADLRRWRERLVAELDGRDCGWVSDGTPRVPSDEPLVSPWRDVRWTG